MVERREEKLGAGEFGIWDGKNGEESELEVEREVLGSETEKGEVCC